MIYSTTNKTIVTIMAVAFAGWAMRYTAAQSSSLYGRFTEDGAYITLNDLPSHYRDLPQALRLRINDLVTIRVDIRSVTSSEGEAQRRRNLLYDAVLRDWVVLKGIDEVKPSGQSGGDPRIQAQINSLFRAEGGVETIESVKFNITATVVDIRPNGSLVLEAHARVNNNDEVWEYSLSGICRAEDIGPDNVILSQYIAQLSVHKRERGHVRDSYRRGWLGRFWDVVRPF